MSLARQYLFTSHQTELPCSDQIRYTKQWILPNNSTSRQRDLRLKLYIIIWKLHVRYMSNSLLMWSTRSSERQFTRCLLMTWYSHLPSGPVVRRSSFHQFPLFIQAAMQILLLLSSLTRWTCLEMLSFCRHK